MDVGFAWQSLNQTWKVELLICKAAGIYQDPFNSDDNHNTYELSETDQTINNVIKFAYMRVLSLKSGIYHFVYRVRRSEDDDSDICTSDFYSKTRLASGREVNYIEVLCSNKPGNYSGSLCKYEVFNNIKHQAEM